MNELKELFAKVESVAATRPSYSLPNFLPRPVLELGVLNVLEKDSYSGDALIRELAPLSRRASGYGVSYPLLHEMVAEGTIIAYTTATSRRRLYELSEQGQVRLQDLRQQYSNNASLEQYQVGLNLINGFGSREMAY